MLAGKASLTTEVGQYYEDPLGFVLDFFPWGKGELAGETGPDDNQAQFLRDLGAEVRQRHFIPPNAVMPILMAESSGHGTGKTAMGGWLAWWILSTRPGSIGTVTAGSYTQLEERTWSAIQKWGRMCPTAAWFDIQEHGIYSKEDPSGWKLVAQSCKEENAQSFAGQHARSSTSWYLFDEASEVAEKVWDTAYGGLTDGEPMFFAWGQCVRNTGRFYEICFGSKGDRWNRRTIDSRTSKFANAEYISGILADEGEDSDTFRVRVLGLAPSASELQYIERDRVQAARGRFVPSSLVEPLIAGFDVSGGGRAWNVIRFRRGLNMNERSPIRIAGDKDPDRGQRIALCAELLSDRRPENRISALFIDTAFGAPIAQALKDLGYDNAIEVNFGGNAPNSLDYNLRAYMYRQLKDALLHAALPPADEALAQQLCLPGYHLTRGKLVIESKADIQGRGEKSPDDADALALTFARPVSSDVRLQDIRRETVYNSYSDPNARAMAMLKMQEEQRRRKYVTRGRPMR